MLRSCVRAAALAALLVSAAACAGSEVKAATQDVQALLAAAQAGDAAAFETHLDRPALRGDLREKLMAVARAGDVEVDGGPSDFALDRRIGPYAFELAPQGQDRPLPGPPSPAQTRAMLKVVDRDHVCVHDLTPQQACLLTFAREKPGWRLVGMPARPGTRIEVPPEPSK
jgi:hypothetical protein